MEARLAIEKSIGSADCTRELVVKKAAAIVEPLRVRGLRVGDALGQIAPVVDGEYMQGRIFTAVFRQTIDYISTVRRGLPPVQRYMAFRTARQRRIDEYSILT